MLFPLLHTNSLLLYLQVRFYLCVTCLLGILLSVLLFAQVGQAKEQDLETQSVILKQKILIEDEVVRLKDIFLNIGNSRYKDRVVLEAPNPGENIVLPAYWLSRLAESYRIDWQPLTRFDEAQVVRSSRVVEEKELKIAITEEINRYTGKQHEYAVELDSGARILHLPSQMVGDIRFTRMDYHESNGRFSVWIDTRDGKRQENMLIRGFAQRMVDVPVFIKSMAKGKLIKKEDLSTKQIRWNRVPRHAILQKEELIGMAVRTRVEGDTVLRQNQIEKPVLVRNKNLILVELWTERMSVKLRAQAMEDGHMGELIRVKNLKSKKIFEAEVTGLKKARLIMDNADIAYVSP